MRKLGTLIGITTLIALAACGSKPNVDSKPTVNLDGLKPGDRIAGSFVAALQPTTDVEGTIKTLATTYGVKVSNEASALKMFSFTGSDNQAKAVKADARIAHVFRDYVLQPGSNDFSAEAFAQGMEIGKSMTKSMKAQALPNDPRFDLNIVNVSRDATDSGARGELFVMSTGVDIQRWNIGGKPFGFPGEGSGRGGAATFVPDERYDGLPLGANTNFWNDPNGLGTWMAGLGCSKYNEDAPTLPALFDPNLNLLEPAINGTLVYSPAQAAKCVPIVVQDAGLLTTSSWLIAGINYAARASMTGTPVVLVMPDYIGLNDLDLDPRDPVTGKSSRGVGVPDGAGFDNDGFAWAVYAAKDAGVLMFAGAGDQRSNAAMFAPAAYGMGSEIGSTSKKADGAVITVGAMAVGAGTGFVNPAGLPITGYPAVSWQLAHYSNFGQRITFVAPGGTTCPGQNVPGNHPNGNRFSPFCLLPTAGSIQSLSTPGREFRWTRGTNAAASIAAGIGLVVASHNTTWGPERVVEELRAASRSAVGSAAAFKVVHNDGTYTYNGVGNPFGPAIVGSSDPKEPNPRDPDCDVTYPYVVNNNCVWAYDPIFMPATTP